MKTFPNQSLPKAIIKLWQSSGKTIRIHVDGHSMRPYLKKNDQVELHLSQPNVFQFKIGDVIAFLQDDIIVIHRYLKKKKINNKWMVCQRGDNLRGFRWIDSNQIIGTATAIYRDNKKIDLQDRFRGLQNRCLGCLSWIWVFGLENMYKA